MKKSKKVPAFAWLAAAVLIVSFLFSSCSENKDAAGTAINPSYVPGSLSEEIDLEHCTLSIVYDNKHCYWRTPPLLEDYIEVFQRYSKYPELLVEKDGFLTSENPGLGYIAVPGNKLKENKQFSVMLDYMGFYSLYPISQPLSDAKYPFTPVDPSLIPQKLIILWTEDGAHLIDIVQSGMLIYCNGTEMDCTAENRILLDCFERYILDSHYPIETVDEQ